MDSLKHGIGVEIILPDKNHQSVPLYEGRSLSEDYEVYLHMVESSVMSVPAGTRIAIRLTLRFRFHPRSASGLCVTIGIGDSEEGKPAQIIQSWWIPKKCLAKWTEERKEYEFNGFISFSDEGSVDGARDFSAPEQVKGKMLTDPVREVY